MSAHPKMAGVIGYPVEHSLSPRLHRYWLSELGITGVYLPLSARPEQLSRLIAALQAAGFAGINLTIPHKQAAFALSETVDEAAQQTMAVNLLVFKDGKLAGANTDVGGLCASLVEAFGAATFARQKAVLLGAGGAARASILALDRLGVRETTVIARDRKSAETAIADLQPYTKARLAADDLQAWPKAAAGAGLLINATSGGMLGAPPLVLSLDPLPKDAAVYDLVYNPPTTALLRKAKERGHRCADGLGMLMHQAVPSFEAFFGVRPAVSPGLRAHLEQALTE